jgi:hypothetical protein
VRLLNKCDTRLAALCASRHHLLLGLRLRGTLRSESSGAVIPIRLRLNDSMQAGNVVGCSHRLPQVHEAATNLFTSQR